MRTNAILLSLSAVAAFSAGAAHAATNLVSNGNFEQTTNGTNLQLSAVVNDDPKRTTLTGWTSSNGNDGGYNFVLDSSIANTWDSAIWLRDAGTYKASSYGDNVFASDALYHPGTLTQTITGLTANSLYTLTFSYALGQQSGFEGANSGNYWQVGFGGNTQNSTSLSIADGGFSGWQTATMTFTATAATQALSFLAQTSSPGAPPFLLLDGVSLVSSVPEPATWGMLLGGLGLLAFTARRRAQAGVSQ